MRTLDAHAAFLNNVNAIVNVSDIEELNRIVDVALREYNELYRDFYTAFSLSEGLVTGRGIHGTYS
jgi:hypothetical protein